MSIMNIWVDDTKQRVENASCKETISVVLNINPSPTIFLDPPPT